jgi:hypothetical protein
MLGLGEELLRIAKDKTISNEEFERRSSQMLGHFFGRNKVKAPKKKVRRGVGSY